MTVTAGTTSEPSRPPAAGAVSRSGIGAVALVVLAMAGSGLLWYLTLSPLARPYGVGAGIDRLHNLAYSQVVAAGNSPFESFQIGQPVPPGRPHWVLWSVLIAVLSGFDPERALAVYDLMALFGALAWPAAVFLALRPWRGVASFSHWEAALAAFFAALLASQPFDFSGPFRDPWALNFLLKPNHTLSLVLAPLLLRGFAEIATWRGRILVAAGILLLGGLFLLHQIYLCLGLLAFVALEWALRRSQWRTALLDVAVTLGLSLLVGLIALGSVLRLAQFLEPSLERIPGFTPVGLDVTLGAGWLFYAALFGAWTCLRRPGRLGLLLVGQWLAAYALAAAYWPARWMSMVRSVDEVYYWLRFFTAILAGIGALAIARRMVAHLLPSVAAGERLVALALCVGLLPHTQPLWWSPARMDAYHRASLQPLPEELEATAAFLRRETLGAAVVAADPSLSIYFAALGARRVLVSDVNPPPDHPARRALFRGLVEDAGPESVAAARTAGVTHLVLLLPHDRGDVALEPYSRTEGYERLITIDSGTGDSAVVFRLQGAPAP